MMIYIHIYLYTYVSKYIYIHALVMISLPQVHTADFDDHQELPQVKDLGKNLFAS